MTNWTDWAVDNLATVVAQREHCLRRELGAEELDGRRSRVAAAERGDADDFEARCFRKKRELCTSARSLPAVDQHVVLAGLRIGDQDPLLGIFGGGCVVIICPIRRFTVAHEQFGLIGRPESP